MNWGKYLTQEYLLIFKGVSRIGALKWFFEKMHPSHYSSQYLIFLLLSNLVCRLVFIANSAEYRDTEEDTQMKNSLTQIALWAHGEDTVLLLSDVGGPSPLWAVTFLGRWSWKSSWVKPESRTLSTVSPWYLLQFLLEFLPWLFVVMDCDLLLTVLIMATENTVQNKCTQGQWFACHSAKLSITLCFYFYWKS